MSDPRERTWDDIHDLLPAGWSVGPALFNHDPSRPAWGVAARGPARGRRNPPESIDAEGEDELAALTYLVLKLRELDRADHMAAVTRRARRAYLRGAEDAGREATGEPMTAEAQERVIERFPAG